LAICRLQIKTIYHHPSTHFLSFFIYTVMKCALSTDNLRATLGDNDEARGKTRLRVLGFISFIIEFSPFSRRSACQLLLLLQQQWAGCFCSDTLQLFTPTHHADATQFKKKYQQGWTAHSTTCSTI
jgi:hypothetical protein